MTLESFIESGNTEVAEHDEFGLLHTVRRRRGPHPRPLRGRLRRDQTLTVMGDRKGFTWKAPETWGEIDKLVAAKWERMKLQPSELCSDEEFVRRIHLDLTGCLRLPTGQVLPRRQPPHPREARRPRRRTPQDPRIHRPLDEQVERHAPGEFQVPRDEGARLYRDWIRKEVEANTPYDQFAYKIITASGSNKENPAASYYKILREPAEIVENTTHLFLATRFNCNKCHDHPFERWTQDHITRRPRISPRSASPATPRTPRTRISAAPPSRGPSRSTR